MHINKKVFIIGGVAALILTVLFVFGGAEEKSAGAKTAAVASLDAEPNIQTITPPKTAEEAQPANASGNAPVSDPLQNNANGNLTDIVRQSLLQNLNNPSLLGDQTDGAANSSSAAQEAVGRALQNFNYHDFLPKIEMKDIRVAPAGDKLAVTAYVKTIEELTTQDLGRLLVIGNEKPTFADFRRFADSLDIIIQKLYGLAVPSSLAEQHLQEIILITGEKKVMEAIANADIDPMKALIALQAWPLINQEISALHDSFGKIISENK